MEQLTFSLERRLEIMSLKNLTSDEFDLIQLIFMAQEEEGHPEFLGKWFRIIGLKKFRECLQALKDKDVILSSYKIPSDGDEFIPDEVPLNKNFLKCYLKHSGNMGGELFNAYPSFTNINGKAVSLKNISKYYSSLDDFFFSYGKAIRFNPEKHEEVLELVKKATELELLHYGILEFVISQKWITLAEEIENGIMNRDTSIEFNHEYN